MKLKKTLASILATIMTVSSLSCINVYADSNFDVKLGSIVGKSLDLVLNTSYLSLPDDTSYVRLDKGYKAIWSNTRDITVNDIKNIVTFYNTDGSVDNNPNFSFAPMGLTGDRYIKKANETSSIYKTFADFIVVYYDSYLYYIPFVASPTSEDDANDTYWYGNLAPQKPKRITLMETGTPDYYLKNYQNGYKFADTYSNYKFLWDFYDSDEIYFLRDKEKNSFTAIADKETSGDFYDSKTKTDGDLYWCDNESGVGNTDLYAKMESGVNHIDEGSKYGIHYVPVFASDSSNNIANIKIYNPTGIKIAVQPTKTNYVEGQKFNANGMKVVMNCSDRDNEFEVTDYTYDDTTLTTDTTAVKVYATLKNNQKCYTSVPISVTKKAVKKIEMTKSPDKSNYVEGETLNLDGAEFTATYNDGTTEVINNKYLNINYSDGNALTTSDTTVNVSYGDGSVDVPVTVVSKQINSLTVINQPNKISYYVGENIDLTGAKVQATFNDGSTAVIADYTSTPSVIAADTTKITVTKNGKSATIPIAVSEKAVTSIAVTTQPTKTSYIDGQKFDKSGMVVKAVYSDGSEKTITDYTVETNTLSAGTTKVYVTYGGLYTSVPVTVAKKVTMTGIKVATQPTKTSYIDGQKFDKSGMVVKAVYSDGSEKTITDYYVDEAELAVGTTTVYVTYNDFYATVPVSVAENGIKSIEITQSPDTTNYVEGQKFNANGMVVTATYADGSKADLPSTSYSYNTNALTTSDTEITVTAGDLTAAVPITVVAKAITGIEVIKNPNKMSYVVGQPFDISGMIVQATYNDGTTAEIFDYTYQPEIITGTNSVRGDVNGDGVVDSTDAALVLRYIGDMPVSGNFDLVAADCDGLPGINLLDANWILRYATGQETGDTGFTGKDDIVISKDGFSDTITVDVVEKAVTSLEVTTQPTKTTYLSGEKFDKSGMVITATYNDGTTATITDYVVDENGLTAGTDKVYVTYDGVYTTVPVTVNESKITDIKVIKEPTKTDYVEGQDFDTTGMVVQVTYEDGRTEIIIDYKVNPDKLSLDDTKVTISKDGKETTVPITVIEKSVTGIEITKLPDKLSYSEGESFDPTGMKVTAKYNDGTTAEITDYTYTTKPFEKGDTSATVEYKGYTADVDIILTVDSDELLRFVPEKNGDVNRDGYVTPEDAVILNKILSGFFDYGYKATHTGDIDGDGVLTNDDVTLIKNYINGNVSLSGDALANADIDGDGEVTAYDAELVEKAAMGMWSLDTIYKLNADANDDGKINEMDVIWILTAYYKHTTVDHISIVKEPNTTNYVEGQSFNPTGMVVQAVYKDGTVEEITDYTYPVRPLTTDDTSVVISFDGNDAEQPISVYKKAISGSDDDKYPTTEVSTENTTSENSSEATTSDSAETSTRAEVSETTTSNSDVSTEITTSSEGSTETTTEDNNGNASGVRIVSLPTKRDYVEGQIFEADGIVIEISYNDGSKEYINSSNVTVDETPLKVGDKYGIIYFTYNDLTEKINVPISVTKKDVVRPVTTTEITTETTTETTTEVTTEAETETTTKHHSNGGAGMSNRVTSTTTETTIETTTEKISEDLTVVEKETEATTKTPFKDVADWAEEYIEYLHNKGILNGVTDDLFKPDMSTKRGDFAVVLYRMLDLKDGTVTFTDVSSDSYYAEAISACASADVFVGYGNGTFKPEQTITREEMFVIMAKLFAGKDYNFNSVDTSNLADFTDGENTSLWAKPYVAYLISNDTVVGENGNIKPHKMITRAEMAVVIYNYLNK
ncbi:MAG: bacterial Ig-like domain-containing protein [Lachnospirales bacterium]